MHSTIPHQHSNELSDYDHSKAYTEADGLIDYVKLLFITDLGEGHMETFDQGNEFDLNVDFLVGFCSEISLMPITASFLTLKNNRQLCESNSIDDVAIVSQYFLSHIDFRGPPAIA